MHPLSIFPQLFFLELLAPFLLRLIVGFLLLSLGKDRYHKTFNWSSIFYIVSGILIIVGLYTQIALIVGVLVLIFDFYLERKIGPVSKDRKFLYVMAGIILISLLFTGPGFWAFDLPL